MIGQSSASLRGASRRLLFRERTMSETSTTELSAAATDPAETHKPDHFTMSIQGGMLEALGINMYTTIGKCLVEFVANAYDGDASRVDIMLPVEKIRLAREEVRERAKAAQGGASSGKRSNVLLLALPDDIRVTVRDNGHGMTPDQVQGVFLPVNRKRRLDEKGEETRNKTESGRRFAMGRKGLGKLAGFGAAECITIETKRRGQTFATRFSMNYADLSSRGDLTNAPLPATYVEGLQADAQYTEIVLSGLKCDAVRNNDANIRETIAEAFFGILPTEFDIRFNGETIEPRPVTYEFSYPEARDADGFADAAIGIDMMEPLQFKYVVHFRQMGAHLPAAKRGARIYCNGRLAAGPSLFDLPTGMHNFHAQSYMECVVVADELDRFGVDIINTNRTSLRQDSELVEKFLNTVTAIMEAAIKAHAKFRERQANQEIDNDPTAKAMMAIAKALPSRTRKATRKLIASMAAQYGVDSVDFTTVVPLVLNAANATEVLIKLTELGANPDTIEHVAEQLRDLAEIEKSDALKLFRARKNGIDALQKLESAGEEKWRERGFEKLLHQLFKDEPWLIKPEFGRPFVSDEDLGKLASKLAEYLKVDAFTPPDKEGRPDKTRPDLVFLMGDSVSPHVVTIVELKSPSLPLEHDHLNQLKGYMRKVEEFLETELHQRHCVVTGYLIGAMPDPQSTAEGCRDLMYEIKKRGSGETWEVIGIRELIARARATHMAAIETLEKELESEADQDEPQS